MGYKKVITYTLQSESGSSLKAIGGKQERLFDGQQWNDSTKVKRNFQQVCNESKIRWVICNY